MKVDVRIDRIVLDRVALTRRERAALAGAVQRELHELLRSGPAGRAASDVASQDSAPPASRVDRIGRDVAIAVRRELPSAAQRGGLRR